MHEKNKLRERLNTIKRCLSVMEKADKGFMTIHFAVQIPSFIREYLNVFRMAKFIDMVISASPWQDIIMFAIVTGIADLTLSAAECIIKKHDNRHNFYYHMNQRRMIWEKIINMDYVHIEKPDTYVMERRAIEGIDRMGRVFLNLLEIFSGSICAVFGGISGFRTVLVQHC